MSLPAIRGTFSPLTAPARGTRGQDVRDA
jgi:hypothetical protein